MAELGSKMFALAKAKTLFQERITQLEEQNASHRLDIKMNEGQISDLKGDLTVIEHMFLDLQQESHH